MVLSVQHLWEQQDAKELFSFEMDLSAESLQGETPFVDPVTVSGCVEHKARLLCLSYTMHCVLGLPCDRCLELVSFAQTYEVIHLLEKAAEAELLGVREKDDVILVERDRLDLAEVARSDLWLLLPHQFLCDDDCAGLCMTCGANQNLSSCDCVNQKPIDPRLAVLGTLLEADAE